MSPNNLNKHRRLAKLFGLTLIVDCGRRGFSPQYIVADTVPSDHIKLLPKTHWRVMR